MMSRFDSSHRRTRTARHAAFSPSSTADSLPVATRIVSSYIDGVDPVILDSARKHGIPDDDMLHAYRNPTRVFELDDLVMLIGANRSGQLLELGVATAERIDFIIHAMAARAKFLE